MNDSTATTDPISFSTRIFCDPTTRAIFTRNPADFDFRATILANQAIRPHDEHDLKKVRPAKRIARPALTACSKQVYPRKTEGICVKGSIYLESSTKNPYWVVSWPQNGKRHKFSRYVGDSEVMYQTHPNDKKRDMGYQKATKLLSLMQGDEERGVFRIENYIGQQKSDIIPYLEEWLVSREGTLSLGSYKKYSQAVHTYLIPFFTENPVMLREVRYDTLVKLLRWIPGGGKHKKDQVDVLRCCLKYAWKSERIPSLPPFPEAKLYDLRPKAPVWLPSDRYFAVIEKISEEHRPFFMFLYLHLRRPGEAMALLKSDYDKDQDTFLVHRGVSGGKVVDRTKDGKEHVIPCHSEFKPYLEQAMKQNPFSPYLFTNSNALGQGKRYTEKVYRMIWAKACAEAGEKIDVYRGTKTSRASQMVNEHGMNIHDLQIAGDWATLESVKAYARASVSKRRELLERKVVPIEEKRKKNG